MAELAEKDVAVVDKTNKRISNRKRFLLMQAPPLLGDLGDKNFLVKIS